MIRVREFVVEDAPRCLELGERFHRESRYREYDFDRDKVLMLFAETTIEPDLLFLVSEDDSGIQGGLCLRATEHYFGHDRVARDLFLFVAPEKRGARHALALVDAGARWAKERGCKELVLSSSTGIESERVARFFEKLGFEQTGSVHVRRL